MKNVKLENGQLTGWDEFEAWAIHNDINWGIVRCCETHHKCSREDAIKYTAHCLTLRVHELENQVKRLSLIAPRKMRWPDGTVRVWHCPNEFVPIDESMWVHDPELMR